MQRVVTTNKEDEQDETVQESSGCGAGGRYGSLHADGVWQQRGFQGEGCPEGCCVTIDSAKMASANKASGALEKATETFKGDAPTEEEAKAVQAELKKMTEFSFNDATGSATTSKYDLYIWTNGVVNKTEGKGNTYSYLKKVEAKHVTEQGLKRLLAKNFIKQGEFKGTQSDYDNLKAVLKGVESAGVSIQKVYGVDVLLVVVEKGTAVSNLGATTPAGSGT